MLNFQIHLKLKQVIKIEECHERSIMACLKLLLNEKLGLSALYPNNSIQCTLNEYSCCVTSEYSRSRKGIFTGPIGKV